MDPLMRRINELAQKLAAERQAVSLNTAENLVAGIATDEGIGSLPAQVLNVLGAELCELVEKHWAQPAARRDDIAS